MRIFRNAILGLAGVALLGGTALAQTPAPTAPAHPRVAQVEHRVHKQERRIVRAERKGEISPAKAHRLLVKEHKVAKHERRVARAQSGHITRVQEKHANKAENNLGKRVPG